MANAWLWSEWEWTGNWRSISPKLSCHASTYFGDVLSHCIPFFINLPCCIFLCVATIHLKNKKKTKKKSIQPSPSALEHPNWWYRRCSQEHSRVQPLAKLGRTGLPPRGHAGPAQQCQWHGIHTLPGHSRLCPGPLAGSGAPKPQGQEWRLCGWPPLLHLSTWPRCAGPSQPSHLPWHQRFTLGEWKRLRTVETREGWVGRKHVDVLTFCLWSIQSKSFKFKLCLFLHCTLFSIHIVSPLYSSRGVVSYSTKTTF